jgi:hypothetical protein
MVTPWTQIHIKTRGQHIISGALVVRTGQRVGKEVPMFPPFPSLLDASLSSAVAQVHYDQVPIVALAPTPCHQVMVTRIFRPANALTQIGWATFKGRKG